MKNADAFAFVQSSHDHRQRHGQGLRPTDCHCIDNGVHRFLHIEGQQSGRGPEDLFVLLYQRVHALGAGYAGDLLINGTVISIAATDTLISVKDKINNANAGTSPTGVTAGILSYGAGDHRLVLTSDNTGASGIGLLNGGATDILIQFGFTDSSRTTKNHLAGGDRTDRFSSTNVSIKSLLGLTATQMSAAGKSSSTAKRSATSISARTPSAPCKPN